MLLFWVLLRPQGNNLGTVVSTILWATLDAGSNSGWVALFFSFFVINFFGFDIRSESSKELISADDNKHDNIV